MARHDDGVVRITSASPSHSSDLQHRQRRYVISMGIRTVCFLLAVVFAPGWLMWIFIVLSFLLPYVAVVMANAGASTDPDDRPDHAFDPTRRELGPGGRS